MSTIESDLDVPGEARGGYFGVPRRVLGGAARDVQIRLDRAHLASLAGAALGRAGGAQTGGAGGVSSPLLLALAGPRALAFNDPRNRP